MGDDADDVLTSTNISGDNCKKYAEVLEKFDGHFKVRKNVIFERACFNTRVQAEGESIEQYITSLYNFIEHCEYGTLKEEMIRDQIVVCIRDSSLSERLQMDESLTLEKAKKLVRQRETVKEQRPFLKKDVLWSMLNRNLWVTRPAPRQKHHCAPDVVKVTLGTTALLKM